MTSFVSVSAKPMPRPSTAKAIMIDHVVGVPANAAIAYPAADSAKLRLTSTCTGVRRASRTTAKPGDDRHRRARG